MAVLRVFKVLIPDNMKAIVVKADTINPQFNVGWLEYAQARGFVTDPARVCSPQDHAWSGWCDTCAATSLPARFVDLADAQDRAEVWCRDKAGQRMHGTIYAARQRCSPSAKRRCCCPRPRSPIRRRSMRRVVSTQGDQAGHCQLEQSEGDFRRVRLRGSPGRV